MTTPVLDKVAQELAEAERDLTQRQAEGKPWMIQSGEKRVALARKKLQHFQFLATEIDVDAVKYGKPHVVDVPQFKEPPAPEMTEEEAVASYKVDPELVKECVAEVKADIKASWALPAASAPSEPPLP